jgi:hypothetical protein
MPLENEDVSFLVLNGGHLKKMATAREIAAAVGVSPHTAEGELAKAVGKGWALDFDGKILLAPEGTKAVHDFYGRLYAPLREDPAMKSWYDRFETLNDHFIKSVSDWQKNESDERALSKTLKVVERLIRALGDLVPRLPRYENYVRRFTESVGLIDQGNRDYVCGPTIDSVHTIWFEFHEDILSVLGRPRDV